ncbi:MAG TPA: XrtA system polysaccharide chain length determinant [Methylomirabilota bacterium]|nr:XrtA system polysaccharide chain length determinant [Methylomirabilota bacterium]
MASESRRGFGFHEAAMLVCRRGWLALLVFAVPFSLVAGLVPFLPNIYQSTATVLVDRQQVPEAFVRSTVTSALETRLQTITQEILSRSRLEDLITRFGLYADLRRRVVPEAVIERMRKDIVFDIKGLDARQRAAVAFTISYRGSEPQSVALVTNTLASFYIEENLKARERQATGTSEFLKVQVDETKKRLDEQERRLGEFKARHLGELPQFMEANLATLERLHTQLRLNSDNQLRVMERRDAIRHAGEGAAAAAAGPEPTLDRILRLRQELAQLRTQFRDTYPDVIRVKAELAALEGDAGIGGGGKDTEPDASRRGGRTSRVMSSVESELKALKADEAKIRAAVADYERRLSNIPRREQEFQELTRDQASTRELYRTLLGRYEEAQVAESMEQRQKGEQFRIIDPATPAEMPAAPKRLRLLLTGLLLSLGLAVGAMVLAEKLDTSFHSADDLGAFTTVPVLVSVTQIVSDVEARRQRWRFRLTAVAASLLMTGLAVGAQVLARGNEQLVWILSGGGAS